MIKPFIFGGLAACLVAATATAELAGRGRFIDDPDWVRWPTGRDAKKFYPDRASDKRVSGWALLSCRLDAKGLMKECRIAAEAPVGWEFGAATMAVVRRFKVGRDKSGESLDDARVLLPLRWTTDGNEAPPLAYEPGEPSYLVTVAGVDANAKSAFDCPSESDPSRKCLARSISWEARPKLVVIADLVRRATTATSMMECSIVASGALEKCRIHNESPALTDADFQWLAAQFKAPPLADDRTPTAGRRVVVTFEWKMLAQVLAAIEAT